MVHWHGHSRDATEVAKRARGQVRDCKSIEANDNNSNDAGSKVSVRAGITDQDRRNRVVRLGLAGCGCGFACALYGDSLTATPARRRVRVWGPLVVRAAGVRRLVVIRVRLAVVGERNVAAAAQ